VEKGISLSRPLSAAAKLADHAADHHRFVDKRVLLMGEPRVLNSANGGNCLLDSLRLLVRISRNLTVFVPPENQQLLADCRALAKRIAFGGDVPVTDAMPAFSEFDAILCVGYQTNPSLPWTVINSNGWLARVSSGATPLPENCDLFNPIGSLAAACLGVTEVFKRLIRLKESRGRLLDGLSLSLYSYREDTDAGPSIPLQLVVNLLLIGAGAIGNGIVHLLSQLPLFDRISIVDKQVFGEENLGTCILIGPDDLTVSKAVFAEKCFSGRLNVRGFHDELQVFKQRLGESIPYPTIVLAGLDDIDARHQAQSIWPDFIIDGAIGDFPCQVSSHHFGDDTACMVCLFPRPVGTSATEVAGRATGLRADRIAEAESLVTDEDVEAAPSERRKWLRERRGKKVCSVVEEAVARQISEAEQSAGFSPSVPFVACFSACMVVSEFVKAAAGWPSELDSRFQLDLLRGPWHGLMLPHEKRQDCTCVTRAGNIAKWREARKLDVRDVV
jgi:hypothetical protein